jgi:hypothetical protein
MSRKRGDESSISLQKEYFSNSHSYYQVPSAATTNTENMINHSNEYTKNLINWMNIQNKLMEVYRTFKGACLRLICGSHYYLLPLSTNLTNKYSQT